MKLLLGTVAYHQHVQNIARALYEADALYAFQSAGVDAAHGPLRAGTRRWIARAMPGFDRELGRRAVTAVPAQFVRSRWRWELPRVAGSRLGIDERIVDWCWEHEELDLDRACATMVERRDVDGFFGVEHGALASLEAARQCGKPGVVAFVSPHHRTLAKWLEPEYDRFPQLETAAHAYFARATPRRDDRRDREAAAADWIVTNSTFTTESLVQAGVPRAKILTAPLGGPPPVRSDLLPIRRPDVTKFLYVGPVSIRKGAHYLLRAWRQVARPGVELHFYGSVQIPESVRQEAEMTIGGDRMHFHGSVPPSELTAAYLQASVLVLPTLCDGFGMVITEALAHGVPVITTRNAGGADAIASGRNGFVIPAADQDALTNALGWAADHRDDLFAMRAAALASAARWTWADFRERLIASLDSSLGGFSRPLHATA